MEFCQEFNLWHPEYGGCENNAYELVFVTMPFGFREKIQLHSTLMVGKILGVREGDRRPCRHPLNHCL